MKTKKICLFLLLSTFIGLNVLKADCEEAKQEGENLLVSIEPATLKTEDTLVEIVLVSDNIYIEVSENYSNTKQTYYKKDLGDSIFLKLKSPDIFTNITYEIKTFYTNQECGIDPIKVFSIETGIYNKLSDLKICWDKLYLDICKNYYTTEDIEKFGNIQDLSEEKINKLVNEELTKEEEKSKINLKDIIKEYYLYVLIPIIIISIVYIIVIVIVKKRKEVQNEK